MPTIQMNNKQKYIEYINKIIEGLRNYPLMFASSPKEFASLCYGISIGISSSSTVRDRWELLSEKLGLGNHVPNWEKLGYERTIELCTQVLMEIISDYEKTEA